MRTGFIVRGGDKSFERVLCSEHTLFPPRTHGARGVETKGGAAAAQVLWRMHREDMSMLIALLTDFYIYFDSGLTP
jgi:hypothetical protein